MVFCLVVGGKDVLEVYPEHPGVVGGPLCVENCVALHLYDGSAAWEPEEACGGQSRALPEGVCQGLVEHPLPLELDGAVPGAYRRLPRDVRELQAYVVLCHRELAHSFE